MPRLPFPFGYLSISHSLSKQSSVRFARLGRKARVSISVQIPQKPCPLRWMDSKRRVILDCAQILLFGDDGLGYCFGFDTNDAWRIVEVDPQGRLRQLDENAFLSVIERYLN